MGSTIINNGTPDPDLLGRVGRFVELDVDLGPDHLHHREWREPAGRSDRARRPQGGADQSQELRRQAAAHIAGIIDHGSSQTVGGVPSTCANISAEGQTTTYCAGTDTGILTLAKTPSGSITLVNYTTTVPASLFQPPAGATTETLPSGL